jgi:hypothetical protein
MKLTSTPLVLTVALARFTFCFETFNRVKLNDPVSFGELMNMNEFMNTNDGKLNRYDKEVEKMK